jgi:hypothetical protein
MGMPGVIRLRSNLSRPEQTHVQHAGFDGPPAMQMVPRRARNGVRAG